MRPPLAEPALPNNGWKAKFGAIVGVGVVLGVATFFTGSVAILYWASMTPCALILAAPYRPFRERVLSRVKSRRRFAAAERKVRILMDGAWSGINDHYTRPPRVESHSPYAITRRIGGAVQVLIVEDPTKQPELYKAELVPGRTLIRRKRVSVVGTFRPAPLSQLDASIRTSALKAYQPKPVQAPAYIGALGGAA
jgi:hypothetical protein